MMRTIKRFCMIKMMAVAIAVMGFGMMPMASEKAFAQDIIWQGVLNGDIYAPGNPQGAGIGTTTPKAKLHVQDGAFLVEGSTGTIEGLDQLGMGTRMMWIPELGAFRVGTITSYGYDPASASYYWDYENIGEDSVVIGEDALADGWGAIALGWSSISRGMDSIAIGSGASATVDESVAIGYGAAAMGIKSVAIGCYTIANKANNTAIGLDITNNFTNSILLGVNTKPLVFGDSAGVIINGTPVTGATRYPFEVKGNTLINGNLYIGVSQAQAGTHKLAVKGSIKAEEVVVETTWADYVLDETYRLPPLNEVSAFIKKNKHLPEVPPAKKIQEKGLKVADMMTLQMKKIEELTLYAIDLKQENDTLKESLRQSQDGQMNLARRLDDLEERLTKVSSR